MRSPEEPMMFGEEDHEPFRMYATSLAGRGRVANAPKRKDCSFCPIGYMQMPIAANVAVPILLDYQLHTGQNDAQADNCKL